MRAALLAGLGNANPTLEAQVQSLYVLTLKITGPIRQDGAFAWKATFTVIASDTSREIRNLLIQSYGDFDIPVQQLTGRMLCNVVRFAQCLKLARVLTTPRPGNAIAHLRAGFLPTPASWTDLRNRLTHTLTDLALPAGEEGASEAIRNVLAKTEPTAIREMIPGAGDRRFPGAYYPRSCHALLSGDRAAWYGSLDFADPPSTALFHQFTARLDGA